MDGWLTVREIIINFGGKQTWGEIGDKDRRGGVLIAIIWEDVGLVRPRR